MGEQGILAGISGKRVLVVGDAMLDEYVRGAVRRISPEAPVPVLEHSGTDRRPGGAANAAANAAGLGADVSLLAVAGADEAAAQLRSLLAARGVRTTLLTEPSRPTTTKTRVVAHGQQLARIDREDPSPVHEALAKELARLAREALPRTEALLLSDYGKGAVTRSVAQAALRRAAELGVPSVADPKGEDLSKYGGALLLKPNLHEACLLLSRSLDTEEAVRDAGRFLLQGSDAMAVLITRGAQGMDLFRRGEPPLHVPALAREVFDVTGAGDTVAAVLACCLAANASLEAAVRFAARAAAASVGRAGAAAARPEDLLGG